MVDPIKRALLRYFPFAPAVLLAALLPLYWVDVPQYDEWDSVTLFEHLSQHSLTLGLLFKQVNEVAVFDPKFVSRFELLRDPNPAVLCTPPMFIAFDVLQVGRHDVRPRPLESRRSILAEAIGGADYGSSRDSICHPPVCSEPGDLLFDAI